MTLPSHRHEHSHKPKPRRRKSTSRSIQSAPSLKIRPFLCVCSASNWFHHLNSHKTIQRVFTGDAATRRVKSKSQKGGNHLISHEGFSVSVFRAADGRVHVSPVFSARPCCEPFTADVSGVRIVCGVQKLKSRKHTGRKNLILTFDLRLSTEATEI